MNHHIYASALTWIILLTSCSAAAHPTTEQRTPLSTEVGLQEFTLERRLTRTPADGTVVVPTIPPTSTLTPIPGQTVEPAGPVLQAHWPRPSTGATSPTWLLYNLTSQTNDPSPRTGNAFWQVDPRSPTQPQKIMDVTTHNLEGIVGELSPDGQWIAYLDGLDLPFTLRVVRNDGSDERRITNQIGITDLSCFRTFAWSSDGTRLAFMQPWNDGSHFGQAFYVYAPQTNAAPQQVAQVGGADLVGWNSQGQILALVSVAYRQPLQLEAIAVDTGTRAVLATLPSTARLFCSLLSPDRQQLLIRLGTTTYLFTFATGQFEIVDVVAGRTLWGADSTTLLEFSGDYDRAVRLITLPPPGRVTHIALAPQDASLPLLGLLSASPDGRYLVACELDGPGIKRSLLYDIDQQRWHRLAESDQCINVFGWLPVR